MTGQSTCASAADCRGRQVCCGTQANGRYAFSCATSCPRTDLTAECASAAECGRGEECCGTTNRTGSAYSTIACAATCNGSGARPLCPSDRDCPTGSTCG